MTHTLYIHGNSAFNYETVIIAASTRDNRESPGPHFPL